MTRVAVLGALHYDVVVDAPALPRIDETLVGTAVDYRSGGKGGNQAVAASRMGASAAMVGRVGWDGAAETLLSALSDAGVDCREVARCDAPTGMSVAIALPGGDYGAVIVSGANLRNDGQVDWAAPPSVAVIQNEAPAAANTAFVNGLPTDCRLIWNAAPARELPDAIAGRTDLLVVNRVEAEDLSGSADPEIAALTLAGLVRGNGIVTLGGDGLVFAGKGVCRHIPARPTDVVSTHGAGDMFVGALAARLSLGAPEASAVAFAQTAASLFVGCTPNRRGEITAARVLDAVGA